MLYGVVWETIAAGDRVDGWQILVEIIPSCSLSSLVLGYCIKPPVLSVVRSLVVGTLVVFQLSVGRAVVRCTVLTRTLASTPA